MIPRCSRKEIGFARLAAETEAPMLVVDEPELPATICAAILKVAHKTLHYFGGGLHFAGTRLSCSLDPQTGLVTLGQTFVRRSHGACLAAGGLKVSNETSSARHSEMDLASTPWRKAGLPVWLSRASKTPAY